MVSELDARIARPSSRVAASEFASELSTNALRVANSDTDLKGGVPSVRLRGDRSRYIGGTEIATRGRTRPSYWPSLSSTTEALLAETMRVSGSASARPRGCQSWLSTAARGPALSTNAGPNLLTVDQEHPHLTVRRIACADPPTPAIG